MLDASISDGGICAINDVWYDDVWRMWSDGV